jgi:prepilin-type N-terminal cleavage/methylation domain-containing protein
MSQNNNHKNNKMLSSRGFTLVETLVAISILVTVIAGATAALQTGISSYVFSKNQIIAFYLAQEGFEQIRNRKDENILKGNSWLHGFAQAPADPCYFGKYCTVDVLSSSNNFIACPGAGACPLIRQNSLSGSYGYDNSWTATGFRREILLEQVSADEISITVTVDWSKGAISREFKAKENILNWLK